MSSSAFSTPFNTLTTPSTRLLPATLQWRKGDGIEAAPDHVIVEAPLAIEIVYEKNGYTTRRLLGVTMRTPGHDDELALGLLRSEGVIVSLDDVHAILAGNENSHGEKMATRSIELVRTPSGTFQTSTRTLVTTSACGFCGRDGQVSLPVRTVSVDPYAVRASCELLAQLTDKLRHGQSTFAITGGSHAAAISNLQGEILLEREDVGRHNAVDKLIGAGLQQALDLEKKILVLSGRASFELIQKASVAGLTIVIAVGAPSSAAVELAHAAGITLVGFAREQRLNIYTHADRLDLQ